MNSNSRPSRLRAAGPAAVEGSAFLPGFTGTIRRSCHRAPGFTLIELLMVISIIGLLAGMLVGLAPAASAKMREARVRAELNQLVAMIEETISLILIAVPAWESDEVLELLAIDYLFKMSCLHAGACKSLALMRIA